MKKNVFPMSLKKWDELGHEDSFNDLYHNAIRSRFAFRKINLFETEISADNIRRALYLSTSNFVLENGMISRDILECCVYISLVIDHSSFLKVGGSYEFHYCFDDVEEFNVEEMIKRADGILFACALISESMRDSGISLKEIKEAGRTLYYNAGRITGKRIYLGMSWNFDVVVWIIRRCFSEFYIKSEKQEGFQK